MTADRRDVAPDREAATADVLGRMMLAFDGETLPTWVAARLAEAPAAGMSLFRYLNVRSPGQVRELTDAFRHAGAAHPQAAPASTLLVAADQETGQLTALGDATTPFAGNMALGAVDDVALTERVGAAIAREARAMGVNVVYAPDLDLASPDAGAVVGIRSFGDDPAAVGRHGAALVRGLQSAGTAAAIKHFPGSGRATSDPHHGMPVIAAARGEFIGHDLAPFRAGIAAGARMVMSGHVAVPSVTDEPAVPATLSRAVMTGLLRDELAFEGVTISDALDMRALAQGEAQGPSIVAALDAGVDLLLCPPDRAAVERTAATLRRAVVEGVLDADGLVASARRRSALSVWLAENGPAPDLDIVGCAGHRALAGELARRSVTLVADPGAMLPIRPPADGRILAIMPRPVDLTPADTSSTVAPALAAALRRYHPAVDEIVTSQAPDPDEIAAIRGRAADQSIAVVVVGTIDAYREPAQRALLHAVAGAAGRVVAVAMRGPWDVADAPAGVTTLATYSILAPSLDAAAAVLSGRSLAPGRLPVRLPGLASAPARVRA
jgi:beta-N-acetylhexosaminidase